MRLRESDGERLHALSEGAPPRLDFEHHIWAFEDTHWPVEYDAGRKNLASVQWKMRQN